MVFTSTVFLYYFLPPLLVLLRNARQVAASDKEFHPARVQPRLLRMGRGGKSVYTSRVGGRELPRWSRGRAVKEPRCKKSFSYPVAAVQSRAARVL